MSPFILAPHCIIFEFLHETLHGNLSAMYKVTEHDLNLNGIDKKTQACLKQFSYDVANGLEYLTRKDVSISFKILYKNNVNV